MNKPIRCLVIQFARLGDTLQSLMALRAAQQLYPDLEIHMVCHDSFADAARKTSWIKSVTTFPLDSMVSPLVSKKRTIEDQLPALATWIEPLIDQPYDLLVNWSYSEASSYLAALIPARVKLGYSRKRDGTLAILDGWSHYIYSVIQSDCAQEIHLTDILTTQLLTALQVHFNDPIDPGKQAVTSKSFFRIERREWATKTWNHPGKRWMSIQLGNDRSGRKWTAADYGKFAAMVLRRHDEQQIILLGTENEKNAEKEFIRSLKAEYPAFKDDRSRLISMVGKTDYDLWTQIISDSQWLISNKSAASHLASVVGTRVISLCEESIKFLETGPYGNGHYVVKNPNAEALYAIWTYAHTEWQHKRELTLRAHFERIGFTEFFRDVETFRARIRHGDEGGGVVFEPLHSYQESSQRWEGRVWSYLARNWFCGWTPDVGSEVQREHLHPSLMQSVRLLEDPIRVLGQLFSQGEVTARRLFDTTKSLRSENLMSTEQKSRVAELGLELREIETLIQRTTNLHTALTSFHRLHNALLHNLHGNKIHELAHSTKEAYEFLRIGLKDVEAWVAHTLTLSKPIALQKTNVVSLHRVKETL
jgi:ADP-heptose:LPS heptosyltransferase